MEKVNLDSPITYLHGIGEVKAKAFAKLGIFTVRDLLHLSPRGYQNRGDVKTTAEARLTREAVSLVLTVSSEPRERLIRRGMNLLKFRAYDDFGAVEITYFNQPYMKDKIRIGETYRFWGRTECMGNSLQMTSPVCEYCRDGSTEGLASIVPVYPLSAGLSQNFVLNAVKCALPLTDTLGELIPPHLMRKYSLCTDSFAVRNLHLPESVEDLNTARRKLMFDELLILSCTMGMKRHMRGGFAAPALSPVPVEEFTSRLPYEMTVAQKRSVDEIMHDMSRPIPMKRLLCGDVGSGKTVCAFAAAYMAMKNGKQAALMVPTEILAKQHFAEAQPFFAELGFTAELLCGSMTKSQKDRIKARLSGEGERIDLIIGTHALITENVKFRTLALVITDEQHRFGVNQRAALEKKSEGVHTLVMTATPIPRTLTLANYGELDVSLIDELPKGRKKISTFCVDSSYRQRLYGFIEKQAAEGFRTYVVCPAIDEVKKKEESAEEATDIKILPMFEESTPVRTATGCAAELEEALPNLKVGCIHGKMKTAEKDSIMNSFASGETDVLVATTVIEVGVNVPEATLMVVENAERFGLSQLHQLRGRVGRGKAKSWCILISDTENEKSRERLSVMENCSNGFDIAEHDLLLRGPGDFFSVGGDIRQSGNLNFEFASCCSDGELIRKAAECAEEILADDRELSCEENESLKIACDRLLVGASKTVN